METVSKNSRVHQGRNVKLIRGWRNITQDTLAFKLNTSQAVISRIESEPVIDDEMLENISIALEIPVDFLKTFELDEAIKSYVISETTYTNNSAENSHEEINQNTGEQNIAKGDQNITNYNYPIDIVKDLYERLLAEKDEKIALLQQNNKK